MPPKPATETRATLTGPTCDGHKCRCVSEAQELGEAPDGFKRFQVRLGPSEHELWATVGDERLYKSKERSTECFVVDLLPGDSAITFRAEGGDGFGARFQIDEVGGERPSFYESFSFRCGAPGLCDASALESWKAAMAKVKEGKHAPCGSVRIKGLTWMQGRLQDNRFPEAFMLNATMNIYRFSPRFAPGSSECSK